MTHPSSPPAPMTASRDPGLMAKDIERLLTWVGEQQWSVVEYGDDDSPTLAIHSDEETRVCFMATPGSNGDPAKIAATADLIVHLRNNAPTIIRLLEAVDGAEKALEETRLNLEAMQADWNGIYAMMKEHGWYDSHLDTEDGIDLAADVREHIDTIVRENQEASRAQASALAKARRSALTTEDANNLSAVVAYLGIEESDDTPLEAIIKMKDQIFSVIAHGDEQHRAWLKQALDDFFLKDRALTEPARDV